MNVSPIERLQELLEGVGSGPVSGAIGGPPTCPMICPGNLPWADLAILKLSICPRCPHCRPTAALR